MEMQQRTQATTKRSRTTPPPPVCFSLQSSHSAAKKLFTDLDLLVADYPNLTVGVEAIREVDRRIIEVVVSVFPPRGRWDKPTPALKSMQSFISDLMVYMNPHLPCLAERPDMETRTAAATLMAARNATPTSDAA